MSRTSCKALFCTALILILLTPLSAMAQAPGVWRGEAEFGTFEFVINNAGTEVVEVTYLFEDYPCGTGMLTGTTSIRPSTSWPMTNEQFVIVSSVDANTTVTLDGGLGSRTYASGTWSADVSGQNCGGTWEASKGAPSGGGTTEVEIEVDHDFVKGLYWNPLLLPGWGFFVDIQENLFFCAVYGYLNGEPTFVTLQGSDAGGEGIVYTGNAYFTDNDGNDTRFVGNFIWTVGEADAGPAGLLTLTSNILNVTDLELARLSYTETDNVDRLTGSDWVVFRNLDGTTFGDLYRITDQRSFQDGITYARVYDRNRPSNRGWVGFFPDEEDGDLFSMMLPLDTNTEVFYVFWATDTDMYGRFWVLGPGEQPVGGGYDFRGTSGSFQVADTEASVVNKAGESGQSDLQITGSRASELHELMRSLNQK